MKLMLSKLSTTSKLKLGNFDTANLNYSQEEKSDIPPPSLPRHTTKVGISCKPGFAVHTKSQQINVIEILINMTVNSLDKENKNENKYKLNGTGFTRSPPVCSDCNTANLNLDVKN